MGSPTIATSVDFSNGVNLATGMVMAIYAPYSTVTLRNNVSLTGAIAARSIVLENNASLIYSERMLRLYRSAGYRLWGVAHHTPALDSGC